MKGIIVTISHQQNNTIQWTWQDQQYLPRFTNYLKLTYPDYDWEIIPGHDLTNHDLGQYQAAALPPVSEKFVETIRQLNPQIKLIIPKREDFMYMMAPKAMVLGRTTGYLVATGPQITTRSLPSEARQAKFSNESLRQLMRDYPTIYWSVVTFEELKGKLTENATDVTVALTPQAIPSEKFIATHFSEAAVLHATPSKLAATPKQLELMMMGTVLTTMFLLCLMCLVGM